MGFHSFWTMYNRRNYVTFVLLEKGLGLTVFALKHELAYIYSPILICGTNKESYFSAVIFIQNVMKHFKLRLCTNAQACLSQLLGGYVPYHCGPCKGSYF